MKPVTLLISGLAFFSFTQSIHAITLDSKEVTIIIEGDKQQENKKSSNRITYEENTSFLLPNKAIKKLLTPDRFDTYPLPSTSINRKKVSHEKIVTEEQKKIASMRQAIPATTLQIRPPKKQMDNCTLFPSESIVILNQEADSLPDHNLAKHSYLGNMMGATSQSINR